MYKAFKIFFVLFLGILIVSNITLFVKGVNIGNEIYALEKKIAVLQHENTRFETEIFKNQSHIRSASIAAELSFGKFNAPLYSASPKYALK